MNCFRTARGKKNKNKAANLPPLNTVLTGVVNEYTPEEQKELEKAHNKYRAMEVMFGGATNMMKMVSTTINPKIDFGWTI